MPRGLRIVVWAVSAALLLLPILGRADCPTTLTPSNSIQSAVDCNPPGTTFLLRAGTYRMQTVQPKEGDRFIGESGALMTGAEVLSAFVAQPPYWTIGGQSQHGQEAGQCDSTHPACTLSEDLFIDDKPLQRMAALADIGPGKWYFDYAGQTIYMTDNPAGHRVETSVTRSAFNGSAGHVVIQNLIVEKYAIPGQMAAIGDQFPGPSWTVTHCEVRLNHAVGIVFTTGATITANYVHDNGNAGLGGQSFSLVKDNEISGNNWAGFDCAWSCGGVKVAITDSDVFEHNYLHDNLGPGIWSDIGSTNTIYDGNIIVNNDGGGIQHEISYKSKVTNNFLSGNGFFAGSTPGSWLWGAQILVQNSQDVEVASNTVIVGASVGNGIAIINQNRGSNIAVNNWIHDNAIFYLGSQGNSGGVTDDAFTALFAQNRLDFNHYHVPDPSLDWFRWTEDFDSFAMMQADGQEAHGTIDSNFAAMPQAPVFSLPRGASGLPAPVITSSAHQSPSGTLTASYDSSYGQIQFVWGVDTPPTGSVAGLAPASGFQTSVPALELSLLNLQPGTHHVDVYATDGINQSPTTQGTFMIGPQTVSTIQVYPNPWRVDHSKSGPITFAQLAAGTDIKIFTVSGHWVQTLKAVTDTVAWDLKTENGSPVASGIYLYLATDSSGNKTRGKLAIIR